MSDEVKLMPYTQMIYSDQVIDRLRAAQMFDGTHVELLEDDGTDPDVTVAITLLEFVNGEITQDFAVDQLRHQGIDTSVIDVKNIAILFEHAYYGK